MYGREEKIKYRGPAIVFVTTTVFEWKPVLAQSQIAQILLKELNNLYKISIIAYVIMPSHIHLLLGFHKIETLSKTIQMFKSITSRQVKELKCPELEKNEYKLWKPRFDDLMINSEKQLKIKMDYIHNNPVKAGLVHNCEDWKYSSAVDWFLNEEGLVRIDKEFK